MKKLITERDIERHDKTQPFQVGADMILTPSARDFASRAGLVLVYERASSSGAVGDESEMDRAIRAAVVAELGHADREVMRAVRAGLGGVRPAVPLPVEAAPGDEAVHALRKAIERQEATSRAVLSAMGMNHAGILSTLTQTISGLGCDIEGVSQTIVRGFFSMIILVNIDGLEARSITFEGFRDQILAAAKSGGFEVMVMHEDVLRAMHRV